MAHEELERAAGLVLFSFHEASGDRVGAKAGDEQGLELLRELTGTGAAQLYPERSGEGGVRSAG
jgi:hypothetical protein